MRRVVAREADRLRIVAWCKWRCLNDWRASWRGTIGEDRSVARANGKRRE